LKAIVRNSGAHFTCAIGTNNEWLFLDDMKNYNEIFQDLNELYNVYPLGWFFAVYVKMPNSVCIPAESTLMNSESEGVSRKRKADYKDYPLRSKFTKKQKNNKEYYNKIKEKLTEHYQENKEKIKEYSKEYYMANKDIINAKKREYYQEHKEKLKLQN